MGGGLQCLYQKNLLNTNVYCRTRLFENLRMLPHAPGVQMANIPEDGVPLKDESEAIDEANPDKRLPQQIKDKIVEADNEFEDSTKSGNKNETDSSAAPGIKP